jgi:hypothetical protein
MNLARSFDPDVSENAIESKAFDIYCEFIRDTSRADERWARKVTEKVKEEFRQEAREALGVSSYE